MSRCLALEEMAKLVDKGMLRPIVGAAVFLEDVQRARGLREPGNIVGTIAFTSADRSKDSH